MSLVAGFLRPDAFGFVRALSPALAAEDGGFERWLHDHPASGLTVCVDVGAAEAALPRADFEAH